MSESDAAPDDAVAADVAEAERRVGALGRARSRAQRRRTTAVAWRLGVTLLGFGVIAAGVVMLVIPGPGWGAIILGIVLLASEYAWARRVLEPVRRGVSHALRLGRHPAVRVTLWVLAVLASVALIGFGIWYVTRYGFSWTGISVIHDHIWSTVRGWFGG